MTILEAWNRRREMYAEGHRMYGESADLGRRATGYKLRAESRKMYEEGELVFFDAVIDVYGDVEVKWEGDDAIVEGVRYEFVEKASCNGEVMVINGKKYRLVEVG